MKYLIVLAAFLGLSCGKPQKRIDIFVKNITTAPCSCGKEPVVRIRATMGSYGKTVTLSAGSSDTYWVPYWVNIETINVQVEVIEKP